MAALQMMSAAAIAGSVVANAQSASRPELIVQMGAYNPS